MTNFQPQSYSQDELSRIVLHVGENDYTDAKSSLSWEDRTEAARLAKDIAAFANSRDGGFLVIGKTETQSGSFEITGLSEKEASSFETTKVANWLNNRFSPPIRQTCYQVEHDGKTLVVIRVNEFSDIPVICTKRFDNPQDSKKPLLEKGRVYVRGANAESKSLQEESELRELIGLATKKQGDVLLERFNAMLKGNARVGVVTDQEQIQNEVAAIKSDLRSRGKMDLENGWTFCFHPTTYQQGRWDDLRTLEEHIRTKAARLSDTFPASQTGTFRTEWGIANDTYGETWALTRSGIFFYYVPFREDGEHELAEIRKHVLQTARQGNEWRHKQFVEALNGFRWIEFKWNMEVIIQAFAFMSRFVILFETGESISCRFHASPLNNRHLMSFENRLSFEPELRDPCGSPRFSYANSQLTEDLLTGWREECAGVMYRFFELFPDYDITTDTMRGWVDRYVGGPEP